MASKRTRTVSDDTPVDVEDFKLINSISWKMESRLHRAGITTYAQIASSTPAEIASQLGNPAGLIDRITKENWVGQARELAELAVRPEAQTTSSNTAATEGSQRYETFATELLLDEDNQVLHTRMLHVPSGDEELWGGWNNHRLINFFMKRANLPLPVAAASQHMEEPQVKKTAPSAKVALKEKDAMEVEAIEITAEKVIAKAGSTQAKVKASVPNTAKGKNEATLPQVSASFPEDKPAHKLEILSPKSGLPTRILHHDQPFKVRILLDFANQASSEDPMTYTAMIQARNLAESQAQTVHRTHGSIMPKNNVTLDMGNIFLKPGAYRLAAITSFIQTDQNSTLSSNLNFQVEGGVIQVY